ncbi:MAG: hypothetical protein ABJD66_06215 [Cellulophaga sp.]|uniref:hypothetical protein n=1 Tax=unclassified Cellulophaga TaxID=2634405 RepID=UPI000C2BFB74|nr:MULTISPECIES: hypothetical protein [unclassified Cellulophaga]MDO6491149.1 hypothetical protein [Cellulophaga sp. 2_MG-2023]MDO6495318.1 hypothetical protein [Cellulophaga sp. 3_MG-2023]PKB42882.1 hypothetical protein AX016_1057 [Cellulophaga sp. RHA19]
MKKILAITTLILLTIASCKTDEKQKVSNLSNLYAVDGFIDFPFTITNTKEDKDYYQYTIKATVDNDTIGMLVSLKKEIKAGFVNGEPKNMFIDNGIKFTSIGEQSNRLLNFMRKKYNLPAKEYALKQEQIFTCANLNQDDVDYKSGSSRFKIFLEDNEENAELFVNFNFLLNTIGLNEKDNLYRPQLVRLLSK